MSLICGANQSLDSIDKTRASQCIDNLNGTTIACKTCNKCQLKGASFMLPTCE